MVSLPRPPHADGPAFEASLDQSWSAFTVDSDGNRWAVTLQTAADPDQRDLKVWRNTGDTDSGWTQVGSTATVGHVSTSPANVSCTIGASDDGRVAVVARVDDSSDGLWAGVFNNAGTVALAMESLGTDGEDISGVSSLVCWRHSSFDTGDLFIAFTGLSNSVDPSLSALFYDSSTGEFSISSMNSAILNNNGPSGAYSVALLPRHDGVDLRTPTDDGSTIGYNSGPNFYLVAHYNDDGNDDSYLIQTRLTFSGSSVVSSVGSSLSLTGEAGANTPRQVAWVADPTDAGEGALYATYPDGTNGDVDIVKLPVTSPTTWGSQSTFKTFSTGLGTSGAISARAIVHDPAEGFLFYGSRGESTSGTITAFTIADDTTATAKTTNDLTGLRDKFWLAFDDTNGKGVVLYDDGSTLKLSSLSYNLSPATPSITAPTGTARRKDIGNSTVAFTFTYSDPDSDVQNAYEISALRWDDSTNDWGTTYWYWTGSAWTTSPTVVNSAATTVNLSNSGLTSTHWHETLKLRVRVRDANNAWSGYSSSVVVNPFEWWTGSAWSETPSEVTSTSTSITDTTGPYETVAGVSGYRWTASLFVDFNWSDYDTEHAFQVGVFERWGSLSI